MAGARNGNGSWRSTALTIVAGILAIVASCLFGTWRGAANRTADHVASLDASEQVAALDRRELDQRITRLEENYKSIDDSLEKIDERLGGIERAVR